MSTTNPELVDELPEGSYADVGADLRLHYHELGCGDAAIFLHGSGPGASGWSNFHQNMRYLSDRGQRAIAPDLLGYGYSSKPTGTERGYHLDVQVEALAAFCEALDLSRVALIGNSMGGAVAIRFAARHPALVSRLVLMAPGGRETRETYMGMRCIRTMMGAIYKEGVTLEGMRRTFRLQLYDPEQVSDAIIQARYAIAKNQPLDVFKTMRVPNLVEELEQISCPVLALWGADDQFCPVSGAVTLATRVANARVIMLSRCGHWVMVEQPELFNRTVAAFLTEL